MSRKIVLLCIVLTISFVITTLLKSVRNSLNTIVPHRKVTHKYGFLKKRVLDIVFSIVALVIFSPILILVSIFVRYNFGSPIIFKQQRPGKDGKPFWIMKFRTMTNDRDNEGELLADEHRITPFGTFLRSTSLDELPELFNVLRGDMSVVGPRPLMMHYMERYNAEQMRRHHVRPGITGWAQVNGRNAVSWEERFKLDVWYVENMSLYLDLKIIFMTISTVLQRDGINQEGHVTMTEFMGTLNK